MVYSIKLQDPHYAVSTNSKLYLTPSFSSPNQGNTL